MRNKMFHFQNVQFCTKGLRYLDDNTSRYKINIFITFQFSLFKDFIVEIRISLNLIIIKMCTKIFSEPLENGTTVLYRIIKKKICIKY